MSEIEFIKTNANTIDISGNSYGRLTVIGAVENKPMKYLCVCVCGSDTVVAKTSLVYGDTKSCGCLSIEARRFNNRKHGLSNSTEERIYSGIKTRCYNKKSTAYKNYGGRGITMCDRWLESVVNFIDDMGKRPSTAHSIERRENMAGYSPDNCYWATYRQQGCNKRNNRLITHDGITLTMSQWGRRTGLGRCCIRDRIDRYGWNTHDALTRPVGK